MSPLNLMDEVFIVIPWEWILGSKRVVTIFFSHERSKWSSYFPYYPTEYDFLLCMSLIYRYGVMTHYLPHFHK